jgi:hypothetical protein
LVCASILAPRSGYSLLSTASIFRYFNPLATTSTYELHAMPLAGSLEEHCLLGHIYLAALFLAPKLQPRATVHGAPPLEVGLTHYELFLPNLGFGRVVSDSTWKCQREGSP